MPTNHPETFQSQNPFYSPSAPAGRQSQDEFHSVDFNSKGAKANTTQYENDGHPQNLDRKSRSTSKQSRLRKACDSCSLRKVKCDATQPCKPCKALDIPCTFNRPSRRRGPPNRLAESIKRGRHGSHPSSPNSPSSPTYSLPEMTSGPSSHPNISIESICPFELAELLIDDYFTYIHPLQPFPHEPTYRKSLADRADLYDKSFLALTAGMIGSLVANFPRRPQKRLKSLGREDMFSHSVDFVKHCQKIISAARGPGYLENPDLNAYDAATSYFLLTMCASTFDWQQSDLYIGECFTIVRCLLVRKPNDERALSAEALKEANNGFGPMNGVAPVNYIEREMIRRVFWTVFVTIRSGKTFGAALGDISMKAPTASQGYPPLPVEVDDEFIHATYIDPQPYGVLPQILGFNTNVNLYLTFDPLIAIEDSYSIYQWIDSGVQIEILRNCVDRVKHCFDDLPEQLLVWRAPSQSPQSERSLKREFEDSSDQLKQYDVDHQDAVNARLNRIGATEIQKANIHASYLSLRSYYIEKYWNLMNARGMDSRVEQDVKNVRQSIAEDLLNVLSSIRPVHMEPNSVSFTMKIRQIASTLLPSAPDGRSNIADAGVASLYLESFLNILMDLEKFSRMSDANGGNRDKDESSEAGEDFDPCDEDNEEEQLRAWANLREQQREFAKSGASIAGILGGR